MVEEVVDSIELLFESISSLWLKGRKTNFREPHESVDNYLFGKTLFTASKTDPAACRYAAWKFTPTKNDVRDDLKRL